jgi:hypothetical protein
MQVMGVKKIFARIMVRRKIMLVTNKSYSKRRLLIALLIAAVALAFSPIAASEAHGLSNDAYEPNNNTATAKPISINSPIAANLAPDNTFGTAAYDYYKFTVTQAAPYTLEFTHAVPSGATNSSFAYVKIFTTGGVNKGSSYTKLNVGTTYISSDWLAAGTYYIEVSTYGSDAGFEQPYSFVVKKGGRIDNYYYYVRHSYTGQTINPITGVWSSGTRLTLNTDYTVSGTRKAIGLGTATVTGKGNYYGSYKVAYAVYPNQVLLKKVKAGKKKITVSWYKVKGPDKYVVQYKLSSSKKWKSKTVSKSKSSVTISKLKKGKKYNVRVYAYKKAGGKKYSSINLDSTITTAYTSVPGFSSYNGVKTVKVK